jgi:hypothetical protein
MTMLTDGSFRLRRFLLGPLKSRRTRLYCVGIAKSGTYSVGAMFSRNVRAEHEPQSDQLVQRFFEWHEGRINNHEMREWILKRDLELALEVDSSWINVMILDFLAREFPEARFVLTIRDCYSWLNSECRRVLRTPSTNSDRVKIREFVYGAERAVYAPEEQVLKENGLCPLDGYLSRWAAHNHKVLTTIPKERLLIVRTDQITRRAGEIADFAGLPRYAIRSNHTHGNQNPVKRVLIKEIDHGFLEAKIEQHCRPLMGRFFPEIKTLEDVKL